MVKWLKEDGHSRNYEFSGGDWFCFTKKVAFTKMRKWSSLSYRQIKISISHKMCTLFFVWFVLLYYDISYCGNMWFIYPYYSSLRLRQSYDCQRSNLEVYERNRTAPIHKTHTYTHKHKPYAYFVEGSADSGQNVIFCKYVSTVRSK